MKSEKSTKSSSSQSASSSAAKSNDKKPPIMRAEKFAIDRSFEVEAALRGGGARRWAMGLMATTFVLLAISVVSGLASLFFVWRQPPADIYVSTSDGGLFLAPREMTLRSVDSHFPDLTAEERSLANTNAGEKEQKPSIDSVPLAPLAASAADAASAANAP